jgi:hypothetical protein
MVLAPQPALTVNRFGQSKRESVIGFFFTKLLVVGVAMDHRSLNSMVFALDAPAESREATAIAIRQALWAVGIREAQDIINLGCTGLVLAIMKEDDKGSILTCEHAKWIRENMGGSLCGLPCYVPSHLFCHVHNTIGGLQESCNKDGPQRNPYPEALKFISRELTTEEGGKLQGVKAFIADQGAKEAKEHFGAERAEDTDTFMHPGISPSSLENYEDKPLFPAMQASCPVALPPFMCREHSEFNPGCRYCLAQSIVEGDLVPPIHLRTKYSDGSEATSEDLSVLPFMFEETQNVQTTRIELYVLAARWVRKLTKE